MAALSVSADVKDFTVDNNLADSSRVYDLDEVVVVAQPKEQFRLRVQPVSSSMFSVDEIASVGARDLRELASYVPSFAMPNYGSRYTSSIYVRGIGSRVNSPAVGIYVDGMPLATKSQFNFHTYSIDRIDVLRGPQGTLYGMNTEGGMVRMYSKNPFNYQGTDVSLGWGTSTWASSSAVKNSTFFWYRNFRCPTKGSSRFTSMVQKRWLQSKNPQSYRVSLISS